MGVKLTLDNPKYKKLIDECIVEAKQKGQKYFNEFIRVNGFNKTILNYINGRFNLEKNRRG